MACFLESSFLRLERLAGDCINVWCCSNGIFLSRWLRGVCIYVCTAETLVFCFSECAPVYYSCCVWRCGRAVVENCGYLPGALERKCVSCVSTGLHVSAFCLDFSNGSTTCMDFLTIVFFLQFLTIMLLLWMSIMWRRPRRSFGAYRIYTWVVLTILVPRRFCSTRPRAP